MLNYKTILIIAGMAALLHGCKPSSKSFSYENNVDKDFFAQTMQLAGLKNVSIKFIKVYRAELVERLVERDAVPEYRLINRQSEQKYARLSDVKNRHYLYLFQLIPTKGTDTVMMYLATSYSPKRSKDPTKLDSICTALGPVYLGKQRRDRIQFMSVLKIAEMKKKDQPASMKNNAAADKDIKRYEVKERSGTTHMIFYNDGRFPFLTDESNPIRIIQIIRDETNKIGGNKAVIFTTEKIFEDPDALVFTYYSTIDFK